MDLIKHLSWSFLQKKLPPCCRKQFPPYRFERVLNNTTLTLMNPTPPQIINTSSKSIDLMRNTSLLFNNPFTPSYN